MNFRECPLCGSAPSVQTFRYYTGCYTFRVVCACGCAYQTPIHSTEDAARLTAHRAWNLRVCRPVKWREVAPS